MQTGRALVLALSKKLQRKLTVFVGRDTRISSEILENALVAGICSAGADVAKLGVVPSAAVAYLTRQNKADAGVMITASHHSYEKHGPEHIMYAKYIVNQHYDNIGVGADTQTLAIWRLVDGSHNQVRYERYHANHKK